MWTPERKFSHGFSILSIFPLLSKVENNVFHPLFFCMFSILPQITLTKHNVSPEHSHLSSLSLALLFISSNSPSWLHRLSCLSLLLHLIQFTYTTALVSLSTLSSLQFTSIAPTRQILHHKTDQGRSKSEASTIG